MLAFPTPWDAVEFCIMVQEALVETLWDDDVLALSPCAVSLPLLTFSVISPLWRFSRLQGSRWNPTLCSPSTSLHAAFCRLFPAQRYEKLSGGYLCKRYVRRQIVACPSCSLGFI